MKLESEVIADPKGTAVNRPLVASSLGPSGKNKRTPCLLALWLIPIRQGEQVMSRSTENSSFCCEHCQQLVLPVTNGSYRNHCPFCLRSKHVDILPGDRSN